MRGTVRVKNGVTPVNDLQFNISNSGTASNSVWRRDVGSVDGSITIRAGRTSATFSFYVLDDSRDEPTEYRQLTLTSRDTNRATISGGTYTHWIYDDD